MRTTTNCFPQMGEFFWGQASFLDCGVGGPGVSAHRLGGEELTRGAVTSPEVERSGCSAGSLEGDLRGR